MNALTKIYRLVWDEDKKLSMNPYDEYSPNSVTYTNTDNYFESNEIGDIEDKINELGLIYTEPEEDPSIWDI